MGTTYRQAKLTTIWLEADMHNTSPYNADWVMAQLATPLIPDYEITRESLFLNDSDVEMPTRWERSPFTSWPSSKEHVTGAECAYFKR